LATIHRWTDAWTAAFGTPPRLVVSDEASYRALAAMGRDVVFTSRSITARDTSDSDIHRSFEASRQALDRALESVAAGELGLPETDLALGCVALSLLRLWARWLGGFADSTPPYLFERFLRRPGYIEVDSNGLTVVLDSRPLDVVLEMAGYMSALGRIPWLADRRLRFERMVP
jgi:hypothetical protein